MPLVFCDTINMIIPGQCFVDDHTNIFRLVLLYEYVVKSILFVFGVTESGYVDDTTFLGMEFWILSCR